jgi:glutamate/aspartate transport system substrate-binding protein
MKLVTIAVTSAIVALTASVASAQTLTGTLQKAKETKKIIVGFQEASIPFSYLDGNQKPVGYTLDICAKIVDAVKKEITEPNLQIEYVPVTSANRIPLLINGTIDMNCASATNNEERQKQVSFVNTHFLTASKFLSKKANNIKTPADLKGKTVVSVAGSTNINQVNKVNTEQNVGMNVASAKDQLEAFLMLETDRAAAYVLDDVQLAIAAARSKDPSLYVISDYAFSKPEPYGIIIRKDDKPFKDLADKATSDLYKSPEIEVIYKKWFQSPVPPNGINFNYPLDPALAASFKNPSSSFDPDVYALKK